MARNTAQSRAEDVASRLEMDILRAGAPSGARVGLRTELINRFKVSPGVMNEALQLLRERDLVIVRPGPGGGVFVADQPPGVRLGALDLWFQGLTVPPLDIFESRTLLEDLFNNLALQRAEDEDLRHLEAALRAMQGSAHDPRRYFETNVDFHRLIAKAARVPMLSGMYDALVLVLTGALVRASYVDGAEETVRHNLKVHGQLLEAIRLKDRKRLETAAKLHHIDMISLTDPQRSPSAPLQVDLKDDGSAG